KKPLAAICHAPWAGGGRPRQGPQMTSYHSMATDVKNAGANWLDQEVVVDQGLITSRNPKDLPAFSAKIIEEVREGRHERRAVA
ncbi:MAG TPA: DJ-1/PfpI family protein, partial [Methyloceanibacter sp.]|nr:DJ-1/PfpI family protein [Methyloceanibacter sp.]